MRNSRCAFRTGKQMVFYDFERVETSLFKWISSKNQVKIRVQIQVEIDIEFLMNFDAFWEVSWVPKSINFRYSSSIPIYGQKRTWPEWPTSTDEVGESPVQSPKTRFKFQTGGTKLDLETPSSKLQLPTSKLQKKLETRTSSLLQNSKTGPSKRQACSRTSKHGGGYVYVHVYLHLFLSLSKNPKMLNFFVIVVNFWSPDRPRSATLIKTLVKSVHTSMP